MTRLATPVEAATGPKAPRVESIELQIRLAREEVRFWQGQMIQASFWLNAGALALVAFGLKLDWIKGQPKTIGGLTIAIEVLGVLILSGAFQMIAFHAQSAIEMNHRSLRLLETAIGLHTVYVRSSSGPADAQRRAPITASNAKEGPVVDRGPFRQTWIWTLQILNVLLTIGGAALLVLSWFHV